MDQLSSTYEGIVGLSSEGSALDAVFGLLASAGTWAAALADLLGLIG